MGILQLWCSLIVVTSMVLASVSSFVVRNSARLVATRKAARPAPASLLRRNEYYYYSTTCTISTPGRRLFSSSVTGPVYESSSDDDGRPVVVKLFTKSGCTLCDAVQDVLQEIRNEHPHTLLAVDITDADKKVYYDKYKYDIPVLHLNDQYWTKHRLTQHEAVEALTAAAAGRFKSPPGEPDASAATERKQI